MGQSVNTDNHKPSQLEIKNQLREKFNISKKTSLISFVGNVCYRKGFDLLLEAFSQLKNKKINVQLYAAGPIDIEFTDYVNKKIDGVFFSNENIRNVHEVIQMSDVLVLPSRNEAYGMAIVEAMASKIPVVVSKIHGVTDYIIANNRGILVDHDPVNIASGIEFALASNNDSMLSNAYNFVIKNCSKEVVDRQYIGLWD